MNEEMIVEIAVDRGRHFDQPGLADQATARLTWEAWTSTEGFVELAHEAEELIDAASAELGHLTSGGSRRRHAGNARRGPRGASRDPSPGSPTGSTEPDGHAREGFTRLSGYGNDATGAAANSQATHRKRGTEMSNTSNAAVAAIPVDDTTPSRRSAAERERRRNKIKAARERAEAERERAEIRRELRAADLL